MGKRKSAKKPIARKGNEPLSTSFKCLFCNHEKSVTVKIDKTSMFGNLSCKICGQKFTTPINNLSAAVDVYCDWVDACEEVRQKQPKKAKPAPRTRTPEPEPARRRHDDDDDDDDDDERHAARRERESMRKSARDAYDDDDDDDDDDIDHRPHKSARHAYDDDDDDDDD